MDIFNISIVAVSVVTLFLGLFIFLHDTTPKKIRITFLLLALSLSVWSLIKVLFRYTIDPELTEILLRLLYIFPIFIPVLFVYFSYIFSTKNITIATNRAIIQILSVITIFLIAEVAFTQHIIKGVTIPLHGEKIIEFGELYIVYIAHFVLLFGASFVAPIKRYLTTKKRILKIQLLNLVIGTIISATLGMVTNLILPWLGYNSLNWLGNLTVIIFVGFIFYSILRYHLFNLKLIATEVFVALIVFLMIFELLLIEINLLFYIKVGALISVSIFGYSVIRSAHRQVQQKDENERLAEYLRNANSQLIDLNKLKTEFVSIASHQLRAPITGIKGYSSLILENSFGEVPERLRDPLKKILDSSSLMADSIQDFLDVSKIEQGKMEYNFKIEDIKKILNVVEEEQTPIANKKGLSFGVTLNEAEEYKVNGDFGKLKQVITNLVDNAIKYTPTGSITITLTKDRPRGKIKIEIEDTGIGIPKESMDNLFLKFTRGSNASKISVTGTGLGLFVAKEMINAHGGNVWFSSRGEGKGSTFYIELNEYKEDDEE